MHFPVMIPRSKCPLRTVLQTSAAVLTLLYGAAIAPEAQAQTSRPTLVITDQPVSMGGGTALYSKPRNDTIITPQQIDPSQYGTSNSMVSRKVGQLHNDLRALDNMIRGLSGRLVGLQKNSQTKAADYYADVATISLQLQSGTTPGNPRLVKHLGKAQRSLESLSSSVTDFNTLAVEVAGAASTSAFLLEATRATYSLSGALEEDHEKLARLEDSVNNSVVLIDRLLNNVNDDMSRMGAYLSAERSNLRTLSLAVADGAFFGKNLSARPFAHAQPALPQGSNVPPAMQALPGAPMPGMTPASMGGQPRQLAIIKFDKHNVDYAQPVYTAMSAAMERYPNARFELVAVNPSRGNAAQMAIESTKARRNAEDVLRSITTMGVPAGRIDLKTATLTTAQANEVHIYMR